MRPASVSSSDDEIIVEARAKAVGCFKVSYRFHGISIFTKYIYIYRFSQFSIQIDQMYGNVYIYTYYINAMGLKLDSNRKLLLTRSSLVRNSPQMI